MKIRVEIYANMDALDHYETLHSYVLEYDDPQQRSVLGRQCKEAFEAGQFVLTYPVTADTSGSNKDSQVGG